MKNFWCQNMCRSPCRGTESTPTSPSLERRRRAGWRRVATCNRDMQSDVANERNWTATQRNQLFAELGAARGFQRLKVSSPGWKMRGRGVGGKAWEPVAARLRAGAHGGSQLARRPGARGRSVPREVPATPPPPPPAPSPAASSLSPSPFPHVWVTSKFREKAAWWLLQRRRDSAAQRAPPGRRGRGGRSSEPAGSLSPEAGPADAAGQTPPAPNLSGKVTFFFFYKANTFPGLFSAA